MKKSNQFTRQISSKIKFTKHQSHQINTNNIYGPKNSSISLITSPNRSKKNVNQDRLFSPSEGIKEKTHLNKQKIKSLQILSPNSKNKVKLDLDIKKTLFEKNSESFMYSKKLKSKDMENDEYLRSINVKSDRSPFKNKVLNKKLMISESKKKGKYDDNNNNITDINNNLDKFKELFNINEDDIENLKLDELYCKILISLIKSNKFNDYNYLYNLLQAIEIEKISIGNAILTPLKEFLENNNDYMEQFIIKTEEDLYDEKIINFYYILLNFILKCEIFIYQLQFLLEIKKTIIKLLKSNKIKNNKINNLSEEIIERYKYVLKTFAGSEYYFKLNKEDINKLKTVLKYFKLFYFESRVKDIEKIEQDIRDANADTEYLKYYQEAVEEINIYPIIERLFYTSQNKEINSEKSLTETIKNFKTIYKLIKDRKISKMRNKETYFKFFADNNNHEILLKVFSQEDIDSFINSNSIKHDNKNKKHFQPKKEQQQNIEENDIPAPAIKKYNISPLYEKPLEEKEKSKNKLIREDGNEETENNNNYNYNWNINSNANKSTRSKTNSKKNENDNINNGECIDNYPYLVQKILNKSIIKLKINTEKKRIEYKEISEGKNNIIIPIEKFIELINDLDKKSGFKKFLTEVEYKLITEFNFTFPLDLLIEIEKINSSNIEAIYRFYEPYNNENKEHYFSYKEENILINGTESNLQGFNCMIRDINQERYKSYFINKQENDELTKEYNKNTKVIPGINDKASETEILEIIKIIDNKNSDNGFIKEISDGYFIYVRIDNIVVLLDKLFNPVMEINEYYNNKIVNVCELLPEKDKIKIENENVEKKDNLKIVLCSNNYIFLTTIYLKENKQETKRVDIKHIFGFSAIEIKNNNYLIIGKNCSSYVIDLFTNPNPQENIYIDKEPFFNSIRINERTIALISNKVYPGAMDILKFYNIGKKKRKFYQREIKGFSIILSPNGLELMPKLNPENKSRILLCACKKYIKGQRNGILLVNPQMEEIDIENPFYDTNNFEVYCFCPILYDENWKIIDLGKVKLVDTNYFLVGGFDTDLREGRILLYKINYGEKTYNTTIEYVQDIIFKDRDGMDTFNGPINCLTQSKKTGNILASCFDGNIYLLTPPNIKYYMEEDINITKID